MCSLVEFQKDQKKILVKNWSQTASTAHPEASTAWPDITDMTQSLTQPLWTDWNDGANNFINADWIIDTDNDISVAPSDEEYPFGIVKKHVTADWDDKLEVTFYQVIKETDFDPTKEFFKKIREEGLNWNGRLYLSAFDQQDLDDGLSTGYAKMSISTVKYGTAKEGITKGDDSWAQDTEACEEKNEESAAGYLAASLASFAVVLAVMNV